MTISRGCLRKYVIDPALHFMKLAKERSSPYKSIQELFYEIDSSNLNKANLSRIKAFAAAYSKACYGGDYHTKKWTITTGIILLGKEGELKLLKNHGLLQKLIDLRISSFELKLGPFYNDRMGRLKTQEEIENIIVAIIKEDRQSLQALLRRQGLLGATP